MIASSLHQTKAQEMKRNHTLPAKQTNEKEILNFLCRMIAN